MIVLAADTSLPLLSVAILRERLVIGAMSLEGKSSRNEKLLPAIDWLLTESGIERREIDLFAATRGPGSFTGVRIGLATIQGLALALGKPVCSMSTHEAIALGDEIASTAGRMVVHDDAGRGELYLSQFDGDREIVGPRLATQEDLAALSAASIRVLSAAEVVQHSNVAASCARRALAIFEEGALERYSDPTPIYVRLAEAEVKLQQKRNA
ncbi:MAG TPA: tRNA (adenosine(37)-N6)-threonylcarbamoyltransferase complex dimerization subunit type 1 TsaB [Thermoanaerobaculia bacterium]|nr:tRNA (adenosine(37)-N6)-threonylcarbamoyltransferase complex dimerization subunit type 1 TsaB [Thermoanaerobaculia bacterium]